MFFVTSTEHLACSSYPPAYIQEASHSELRHPQSLGDGRAVRELSVAAPPGTFAGWRCPKLMPKDRDILLRKTPPERIMEVVFPTPWESKTTINERSFLGYLKVGHVLCLTEGQGSGLFRLRLGT